MDSLTSVAAGKQGLKNQSEKFFPYLCKEDNGKLLQKTDETALDLHVTGLNDTKHLHFWQKIPNSINRRHSQMKCIQCQRQSHMINSAFKNQHYAPMFILKDVYEEATIPEYKQNNSIKQEIIIQNKA